MATGCDDSRIEVLLDGKVDLKTHSLRRSDSYSTIFTKSKRRSKFRETKKVTSRPKSVRPFFCCGSEISLNSIIDSHEASKEDETEFTDLSDTEVMNDDVFTSNSRDVRPKVILFGQKNTVKTKGRKKKSEKSKRRQKLFTLTHGKCCARPRYPSSPSPSESSEGRSVTPRQTGLIKAPKTPAGTLRLLDSIAAGKFDELIFIDGNGDRGIPADEAIEIVDILLSGRNSERSSVMASDLRMISLDQIRSLPQEDTHETVSDEAPLYQQPYFPQTVHTQVDYVHHLVPNLKEIANCGYYWGVMDRYAAEKLLENKPEGTFLLRDSAQCDFLFSVSFRRYNRSLHARVEQWNHKFSFDIHDAGVYSSPTVCGLISHYKDPSTCMFFEPMLTNPSNRTFPFSLKHLCRSTIDTLTTYEGINYLPLPKSLKDYLHYYHYKHMVRVRRFDGLTRENSINSNSAMKI